jgi:hypothetical protein
MMVFLVVSSVATIATINNYMLLYEEKQSNKIEVSEVWERVRETFWMYLGTAGQLTILGIAFYVLLFVMIAFMGEGSGFAVLFIFLLFFVMFYLLVATSLIFIIRAYEKTGFFEALGRSFKLIQGKWWSTFGLIFVLYLIVTIISYVFMIPWYVMTIISTLHSAGVEGIEEPGEAFGVIGTLFLTLYYLAQMLMYALPAIGIAFQYFNLVERKEARGLMNQIGSIGQSPAPPSATDEHY